METHTPQIHLGEIDLRQHYLLEISPDQGFASPQAIADKGRGQAVVTEKPQHAQLLVAL